MMDGKCGVIRGVLRIKAVASVVLVTPLALTAAADPRGAEFRVESPVAPPAVIAVRFRHDMCPYCKAFDPQMPELMRLAKDDSILFVTLDLSSEVSPRQAALLVEALGLEAAWPGDFSKVGMISLVDGKSKKVISELRAEDVTSVRAALTKALASRSGRG